MRWRGRRSDRPRKRSIRSSTSPAGGWSSRSPSAIAIDRQTGKVAEVGGAADALAGEGSPGRRDRPPAAGRGHRRPGTRRRPCCRRSCARARLHRRVLRSAAVVCVPSGATWIERRSLAAAGRGPAAPAASWRLVDEPVAAAAGAGIDLAAGSGAFIVDVGGRDHRRGGGWPAVTWWRDRSLRVGGQRHGTRAIVHAVKAELGLLIGRNARAEPEGYPRGRRRPQPSGWRTVGNRPPGAEHPASSTSRRGSSPRRSSSRSGRSPTRSRR